MAKIIDKNRNIIKQDEQYGIGTVLDLLEDNGYSYIEYGCISDIVKTMTGDASTPFNTIGEMIEHIPEIVSCSEECNVLCVFDDEDKWFILGWDYEGNAEISNQILHTYFPEYEVIEKEE